MKVAVMALNDLDKLRLRSTITTMLRVSNADANYRLHGHARWQVGQMVQYIQPNGERRFAALLRGSLHEVTVWPVYFEPGTQLSLKWEDVLVVPDAPRVTCERETAATMPVPTRRGVQQATAYVNRVCPRCQPRRVGPTRKPRRVQ